LSAPSIAPDANGQTKVFRIIHPFHPCRDRPLSLVTVRQNWGADQIYYHDQKGHLVSVSAHWTDMVPPDPVISISAGRSPFRLEDLLELTRLVTALQQEAAHDR
ncbi:MAG: DUF5372 family protein, partial [Gammaproteobacteria bacterium]